VQAWKVRFQEVFELREQFGIGAVGARVVVDDEFVVRRIAGGIIVGGSSADLVRRMRGVATSLLGRPAMGVLQTAHEELAGTGNVDTDVAVHGVFAEHVDAELLARFGEAPERVQRQHVGVDAAAFVVVHEVEEFLGDVLGGGAGVGVLAVFWGGVHVVDRGGEGAVFGAAVEVVDAGVLVVQSFVEEEAGDAFLVEAGFDDGFEFDVAVVEFGGDWACELYLVRLEARRRYKLV